MLPAFLLALREGLEAALIIGIVLGALHKIRRPELAGSVWLGTGAAAVLSLLAAVLISTLGATFEGPAEAIFEGITMFFAAGVLTWMIFWMSRQARHLKSELETDVRRAALQSSARPLFLLAFLAVLREGIELALFLSAAAFTTDASQTLAGGLLGLAAAALLGWGLYASAIRLDLRRFFQVTGTLLILFAAGLVAHGTHEFNEVGWIPGIIAPLWNTNPILDESSPLGQVLKALFGYNGNPSLTEALAYLGYFLVIGLALLAQRQPRLLPQQGSS
jgi:high-affinity iron transporter